MSTIRGTANESIYKIDKFLGLHENPDGDTKLRLGEATHCENWKVTRDRNLKRRPGFHTVSTLESRGPNPVVGMWFGNIMGSEYGLAAADGHLWKFYANGGYLVTPVDLGTINTSGHVSFFAFSNIVYILNGFEYYYYDGTVFAPVEGYVPLIVTSRYPDGSEGTLLEEINKLSPKRRVWFSPDGTSSEFLLPENDLASIDYVSDTATGEAIPATGYSKDEALGTVTFNSVPARGINTIEIGYTSKVSFRNEVAGMKYAELYLGQQDNAVFIYGDGTNEALYSSIDYNGTPRADYFPDLNEIAVADSNTPITSMIRHFSQLICYKTNSTYNISYGMIIDAEGNEHWGFYVKPVNKSIGNAALGQVQLVQNSPFALHGNDLYEWVNTSRYSTSLSIDERQAKRISDRIYATLGTFDFKNCICYDDNDSQEYYIWNGGKALVYNYPADAWYVYTAPADLSVKSMCNIGDDTLCGMSDGTIKLLSSTYTNDDGAAFESYWQSGSIDFGKPYVRKFMSELWVGIKPQVFSKVTVTIVTDKKAEYTERTIENNMIDFWHMNFADFSFLTNRNPQIKKLKIKAKKFAFVNFILKSEDADSSATVLLIDPKIRETGYVK